MAPSLVPTLRLDTARAWRQGRDAVFLPIVYDLLNPDPASAETPLIPLVECHAPPALPVETQPGATETLSREEKQKNLALLKRRAETVNLRSPRKNRKSSVEPAQVDPSFNAAAPPEAKHLSRSVPLLLICVLAMVFFAWLAFR